MHLIFPPLPKCDADERSAKRTLRNALNASRTKLAGCAGGDLRAAKAVANACSQARGAGQAGQEGCAPGAAIEVDFEVAALAISVIIAIIIINAGTRSCLASGASSQSPSPFPLATPSTIFYYCYGAITVSAINFPFCWSTTCITNATQSRQAAQQANQSGLPLLFLSAPPSSTTLSMFGQGRSIIKMQQIRVKSVTSHGACRICCCSSLLM